MPDKKALMSYILKLKRVVMSQLLKDFIKSEIHPMMKELGYREKANYFWYKNDVFVFTINFQSSQWNFEGRDEFFY